MNNPPPDDATFLKDLVKASRQRSGHVKWQDRDGTERLTTLTTAELSRLETLARERKISKAELLRQTAHIPVKSQA